MSRYEASFEIESKADARATRLLVERAYDTFREELKGIGPDDASPNETLRQMEALREAASHQSPGTLTLVYEQRDETFDD